MNWHPIVLGARQRRVLKHLGPLMTKDSFFLAGGTAIALYLGHRESVDLDWFAERAFGDGVQLAAELKAAGVKLSVRGSDRGTLHASVSGVQVSFLEFRYPLLEPLRYFHEGDCQIASLDDLACMKLSALAQRGAKKDFVDLHAIVHRHTPLAHLISLYSRKFSVRDIRHVLLSLTYFDDADREPMPRMRSKVTWDGIKKDFRTWTRQLAR